MMAVREISVVLHNIRSSENVGSIFRTADAAGISKIYLSGYTPAPRDRFQRKNVRLTKAALGAEDSVPWEYASDIVELIDRLRKNAVSVIAVEQAPRARSYLESMHVQRAAYIFGNEVDGIPEEVLSVCDSVVEIPMHGKKESLNVSVAAGIILFHARTR